MAVNLDTALRLCRAAGAAYGSPGEWVLDVRSTHSRFKKFTHVAHNSTCFVASNQSEVIISFKGTSTVTDVLADVAILPTADGVHGGWYLYVKALEPELKGELEKVLGDTRKKVYITGHSLGGAMAQIYARIFVNTFRMTPEVYAFSSPACFTSHVAAQYNSIFTSSWRVFAAGDPLVSVFNSIYTHTANAAEIAEDGTIQYSSTGEFSVQLSQHKVSTLYSYIKKAIDVKTGHEPGMTHFYIHH